MENFPRYIFTIIPSVHVLRLPELERQRHWSPGQLGGDHVPRLLSPRDLADTNPGCQVGRFDSVHNNLLPCQSGSSHLLCNDLTGRRGALPAVAVFGPPGLRLYFQAAGSHLRCHQWQHGALRSDSPLRGQLCLVPSSSENNGHWHLLAPPRERQLSGFHHR